jgi:hypothetical protein
LIALGEPRPQLHVDIRIAAGRPTQNHFAMIPLLERWRHDGGEEAQQKDRDIRRYAKP